MTDYSLSNNNSEKERAKTSGSFAVYGNDIALHPSEDNLPSPQINSEAEQTVINSSPAAVKELSDKEIIKQAKKRIRASKKAKLKNSNLAVKILSCLVALLLVSAIVFASLYISSDRTYKKAVKDYEKKISDKVSIINALRVENDELKAKKTAYDIHSDIYKEKADFLDEHIAIILEDGNYYHTYDCDYFTGSFWAYNTENAENEGYKPCPHCH